MKNKICLLLLIIVCITALICACGTPSTDGDSHTHVTSSKWKGNAQGHWNPCATADCNEQFNFSAHSESATKETVVTPPTDTEEGVKLTIEYCTVCGYEISTLQSSIPKLEGHSAASVWSSDEHGHWRACKIEGCNERFGFAVHNETSTETVTKAPTCSAYGSKTVTLICTDCRYEISEQTVAINPTGAHTADGKWQSDGSKHWQSCTNDGCTEKLNIADHDIKSNEKIDTPPTCFEKGSKTVTVVCTVCDKVLSTSQVEIPATGEHTRAGKVSCDARGHWYACTTEGCTYRFDSEDHNPITSERVVKEPTCYQNGTKATATYCAVCDFIIDTQDQAPIPATGEHIKANTLSLDGLSHWYACTTGGCSYRFSEESHKQTIETERIEPSCWQSGSLSTLVVCSVCDKELQRDTETLRPTGNHTPSADWQSDSKGHWHTCTAEGCTYAFTAESHVSKVTETVTNSPTCFESGEKKVSTDCELCSYHISDSIAAVSPTGNHVESDKTQYSDTEHWHTCTTDGCSARFSVTLHSHSSYTASDSVGVHTATCRCGHSIIEACTGETVGNDENNHWKICDKCNGSHSAEPHDHDGGYGSSTTSFWHNCSCGKAVDIEVHEGSLHVVSNTASGNTLYVNGATSYTVVFDGTNEKIARAVQYIGMHLKTAVGTSPQWDQTSNRVPYDPSAAVYSSTAPYIVVGNRTMFENAGLTMPVEILGETGYYIVTKGRTVFIMANNDAAYQRAVLAFLRETVGFEAFGPGSATYDIPANKTVYLPNLEIIEKPDFDYYLTSNAHVGWKDGYGDEYYMMGFDGNSLDLFINVTSSDRSYGTNAKDYTYGYNPWHNTLDYLPNKDYRSAHPKWYSDAWFGAGEANSHRYDLCLTAHGDSYEYNLLVEEMAKQMLKWIDANPDKPIIGLTMEDHSTGVCYCSACTAMKNKYNGSDAAALIKFVNAVNRIIQDTLQSRADESGTPKRQIKIVTFAYHQMFTAPAVKNADGTWRPVDETVVCDPEVAVMIAPIEMNAAKSINHIENREYKDGFDAWATCAGEIFVWAYNTNFRNYMYPCYTIEPMIENYRYFKSINANFVWAQGQHNAFNPTGFSILKDYINSQAFFDLSVDTEELVDRFFENYFLDAAPIMRAYYDELMAHLAVLVDREDVRLTDDWNGGDLGRVTHIQLNDPSFWSKTQIDGWATAINNAYAAVEKYKTTNETLYNALVRRIKIESIFIRYAQIDLYASSYSPTALLEMKKSFKADCAELNITLLGESETLDATWKKWGV